MTARNRKSRSIGTLPTRMQPTQGLSRHPGSPMLAACTGCCTPVPCVPDSCWQRRCWRGQDSRWARRHWPPRQRSRPRLPWRQGIAMAWHRWWPHCTTHRRRPLPPGRAAAAVVVAIACPPSAWCCRCRSRAEAWCRGLHRCPLQRHPTCRWPPPRHLCDRPSPDSRGGAARRPRCRRSLGRPCHATGARCACGNQP